MFFLFVFFVMATLKMIPAAGILSQLPHSSTAADVPHPKLIVGLDKGGNVTVDGQRSTLADLKQRLAAGDVAHTAVTIMSDQGASVQRLMDVMDACRSVGANQIALSARPAA